MLDTDDDQPPGPHIRPATRNDALHVAAIIDLAGHGIDHAFWISAQHKDHSVMSAARRAVLDEQNTSYHYTMSHLLEVEAEVAGGLIGGLTRQPSGLFEDIEPYVVPLLTLENRLSGFWTIVAIALYDEFRKRGLASVLMTQAERLATQAGAAGLSLVVEDDNTAALRLYEGHGFAVAEALPWIAYGGRAGPRDWLLMTKRF